MKPGELFRKRQKALEVVALIERSNYVRGALGETRPTRHFSLGRDLADGALGGRISISRWKDWLVL